MTISYPAWPPGSDPALLRREAARAHEEFLTTGKLSRPLRDVVRDSWHRSRSGGVDPETSDPAVGLAASDLRDYRLAHPLALVLPVIRRLLVDTAQENDQLVAVGDERARLLWVEGSRSLAARAERIGFTEGADWAEQSAGTNAPGTALALGRPLQIYASEHFTRPVQAWSCSAAPVRDPDTGAVLGVVDLTGGDHIATPQALSLVCATVAAAEAELRLLRLARRLPPAGPAVRAGAATLEVLGRDRALLVSPYGRVRLSPRHSEIAFLLAGHPRGLSADALASRLHEEESAGVTVRAEMSRLRRLLGPELLASRPYRFLVPVTTDADDVRERLSRGACRQALTAYRGPLLPCSQAPGVVRAREELECGIRRVLRNLADADTLVDWVRRPENEDDVEMLQAAADALSPGSPQALMLRTRLERALW